MRSQVGNDWDEVYSETISRIPTKLLDYKEIVFWFVADKIELIDGNPYNKKSKKFIWTSEQGEYNFNFDNSDFYVFPVTNKLLKVEDKPSKRETKNLEQAELRKYRENKKNKRLLEKKQKQENSSAIEENARINLSENNKLKKSKL